MRGRGRGREGAARAQRAQPTSLSPELRERAATAPTPAAGLRGRAHQAGRRRRRRARAERCPCRRRGDRKGGNCRETLACGVPSPPGQNRMRSRAVTSDSDWGPGPPLAPCDFGCWVASPGGAGVLVGVACHGRPPGPRPELVYL